MGGIHSREWVNVAGQLSFKGGKLDILKKFLFCIKDEFISCFIPNPDDENIRNRPFWILLLLVTRLCSHTPATLENGVSSTLWKLLPGWCLKLKHRDLEICEKMKSSRKGCCSQSQLKRGLFLESDEGFGCVVLFLAKHKS